MEKIKDWWIDPGTLGQDIGDELGVVVYMAMDKHPGQGPLEWQVGLIHVIDATGMPSKEEIRKALELIQRGFSTADTDKLITWLERLAEE